MIMSVFQKVTVDWLYVAEHVEACRTCNVFFAKHI